MGEPELAQEADFVGARDRVEQEHRGVVLDRQGGEAGVSIRARSRIAADGRNRCTYALSVGGRPRSVAWLRSIGRCVRAPVEADDLDPRGGPVLVEGDDVGGFERRGLRDRRPDQCVHQRRLAGLQSSDHDHSGR